MKALVYGSLNIDYVYEVDHILEPGETESSISMTTVAGGKGLNQSIALAKAGVDVYLAGQVGEEGDLLEEVCKDSCVNTSFLEHVSGRSGHTFIQVDRNGQNSILLFGGANKSQKRHKIDEVIGYFKEGDILLLQNEINELAYLIQRAYEQKMFIVLNPSPYNQELKKCDLQKISLFVLNEVEAQQLIGSSDVKVIENGMRKFFSKSDVLLTLGVNGSYYFGVNDNKNYQECIPVKAVDTTGAGDTYTGYFVAMRMKGMTVVDSMRIASFAAAIACTKHGAAPSIPKLDEVENLLSLRAEY